jgi:hypothetical protein
MKHTPAMATTSPFRVWKTITLGTGHKTADDFRAALNAANCGIAACTDYILESAAFQSANQETEIDLVVTSIAGLGFQRPATYEEICARAHKLDLELCPAEVGPQLRLQHQDQPSIHWLYIAMEPIVHTSARLVIFSVDCSFGGHYLGTRYITPHSNWFYNGHFVFAKPRSN